MTGKAGFPNGGELTPVREQLAVKLQITPYDAPSDNNRCHGEAALSTRQRGERIKLTRRDS